MSFFASQNNFNISHQFRDIFSVTQKNVERIGDVGEQSDEFVERAKTQYKDHEFNKLAKDQDSFEAKDPLYGTPGRENTRNYTRMEYDKPQRNDGKEHAEVLKKVNATQKMTVDKIMKAINDKGYTINSTSYAVGDKPIVEKDYAGQEKI